MSWVKRLVALRPFQMTAGIVAAEYLRLVWKTTRFVVEPEGIYEQFERDAPVIIAMWHGQHFLIPFIRRAEDRAKVLVSRHRDGEINALAAERLGVGAIRGSGHHGGGFVGKGGVSAFKEMLGALQDGYNVALTADMPKVARTAGLGIVKLASASGRPIYPIAIATRRRVVLTTGTARRSIFHSAVAPASPANRCACRRTRTTRRSKLRAARGRGVARRGHRPRLCDRRSAAPRAEAVAERLPLTLHAYRLLTAAATPLAPVLVSYRLKHGKELPARLTERYGESTVARPPGPLVWVHGASVGELLAVIPLIERIRDQDFAVLCTSGTVTSANLAEQRLPQGAIHQFVILDTPRFVERFLDHWQPDLALFVESDLWPNLIVASAERGIPLILVNGRLSERSFNRWRRVPGTIAALLGASTSASRNPMRMPAATAISARPISSPPATSSSTCRSRRLKPTAWRR